MIESRTVIIRPIKRVRADWQLWSFWQSSVTGMRFSLGYLLKWGEEWGRRTESRYMEAIFKVNVSLGQVWGEAVAVEARRVLVSNWWSFWWAGPQWTGLRWVEKNKRCSCMNMKFLKLYLSFEQIWWHTNRMVVVSHKIMKVLSTWTVTQCSHANRNGRGWWCRSWSKISFLSYLVWDRKLNSVMNWMHDLKVTG